MPDPGAPPPSLLTPSRIETRLGTLEFDDGAPTAETAARLYDHLDFSRGVEAFLGSYRGASIAAIRRGFHAIGVADNDLLMFSRLMDSASLFLTGNADTVYFLSFVDLGDGPMVLDVPRLTAPSAVLGTIDDMWFRWVTDFGPPGPDRGAGGSYLLAGPDYDGPLPDGGFHAAHARTRQVCVLGRAFMADDDPAGPAAEIRESFRIHRYEPGAEGTAISTFLAGGPPLRPLAPPPPTRFVEGSGVELNTVPPADFSYWELVDEVVQSQPAAAADPELLGLLAAVGIARGRAFAPDERLRSILEEAAAVGNATARTAGFAPREKEGFGYYDEGSAWFNPLFVGGHEFLDPPPTVWPGGAAAADSDGARKLEARNSFFYLATGITPAMCMYLTGVGSQYLLAARDAAGEYLDGSRSYRLRLPAGIPHERFWSVTVYDRQTRSMLRTGQPLPRLGSQSGTVATGADGSTEIFFGPQAPAGSESNWLQTVAGRGWFPILRFYSPTTPFFDNSWRAGEIEPV